MGVWNTFRKKRDSTIELLWLPSILSMLRFQDKLIKTYLFTIFILFIIIVVYSLLLPLYPIIFMCSELPVKICNICPLYLDCVLRYFTYSLVMSALGSPPLLSLLLLRRPTPARIYLHMGTTLYTFIILPAILHLYSPIFLAISGLALVASSPQVQTAKSKAKSVYYAVFTLWLIFTLSCLAFSINAALRNAIC